MSSSKKPTRKKLSEKATTPAKQETFMSKVEQNSIEQLIAQSLLRYKQERVADNKIKFKELSHLATICEEYMSTFALIGYSLEDEKVVMLNMSNSKNEAALVDLLRATFIEIINNRP